MYGLDEIVLMNNVGAHLKTVRREPVSRASSPQCLRRAAELRSFRVEYDGVRLDNLEIHPVITGESTLQVDGK